MSNLNTVEIKAFLPAKDFQRSKQFYADLGFTLASDEQGVAYFYQGTCSFLLQDFYEKALAENLMMHLLVEDVDAWHRQVMASAIDQKYGVQVSAVQVRPWGLADFVLHDPSGIVWRIAQNLPAE